MLKKYFKPAVSMLLAMVISFITCVNVPAASSKKTYVKDVIISYGNTADEAKAWLTNNGYEILDHDLNEGADDTFSTKRSVYLGYTTTDNAEEAITDMRLMNMKGGYSVQDYQILLEEQKENIKLFMDNFIISINEYRDNYNKGQGRAVSAHDLLNLLYDDDTEQYMGDLLLKKIKEEYSDEEWNALSADEQAKTADMTTILMQANSDAVLSIEQTIATATDDGDKLWIERYEEIPTYDEMLEDLMSSQGLTVNEAEKQLAAEYDDDAKAIASKFEDYKIYLENYTETDITLANTAEEVEAYQQEHENFDEANWFSAGTQYELINQLMNDDISLFELITSDDYDTQGTDSYMLYPLVASLTKGQRACLDFLPMYQLIALGINNDESMEKAMEETDVESSDSLKTSVYDGVDRIIFSDDVALTNEALRFQASSGTNAVQSASGPISTTSIVLYAVFTVSVVATAASWMASPYMRSLGQAKWLEYVELENATRGIKTAREKMLSLKDWTGYENSRQEYLDSIANTDKAIRSAGTARNWMKYFRYAGIAMTAVSVVLMLASLWSTYNDLQEYYNVEFTPIPARMVDESVNENDEKVYTYYAPAKCNRADAKMVTDETKLLGDYGDLNGDVGRQWVALYTTKDKAAGNPITTDFTVQYNNTALPNEGCTVLSMFGEDSAQNLTNEQSGYTYDDDKDGIYMFFNTDVNAFAGSVFSNSIYLLTSVAAALLVGVAAFFAGMAVQKKKNKIKEA